MDFIKSLLPPLRLPKLKKLKQWNGSSILNLSQLTRLPSRTRNVGTVPSVATPSTSSSRSNSAVASISNGTKGHARKRSDISIISASVPSAVGNGSLGLYALKCDRNAAKRGILLNLPRKMVAVVGGETVSGSCYQSEEMVHEKFSPCKKVVEPPPRRKRMRKKLEQQRQETQGQLNALQARGGEVYLGDQLLQRNRSELFRIVERGSNENVNQGVGEKLAPPTGSLQRGWKTRSADNILTLKKRYQEEVVESDSDVEQVRSLKVVRNRVWKESKGLKYSESMESDSEETVKLKKNVRSQFKKASEFSIDNNSDEIQVRFKRNESTESEGVPKPVPLPLPNRVVALRQEGAKSEVKIIPKLPETPPPKPVEKFATSLDFADNFKPLASVLQESIKSTDLKRKWINDFLTESDEEPANPKQSVVSLKNQQSNEFLSKKFAMINKFDKQLEALETGKKLMSNESNDSVNLFQKTNADFEEFDKLFNDGESEAQLRSFDSIKKNVDNEQITYINQFKADQLRFSSSSMDSDAARVVPIPPPLPPPVVPKPTNGALPKSTVMIQDYYDKKLQRVRYVSSPSPSRCFDDDSSTEEQTEAVNNNIVLPLSIINRTIVDNRFTTEQVPTSATAVTEGTHSVNEPNQNIYPATYNQPASNDHISCNLHNIDDPSYVGHNQADTSDSTNNHSHNVFIVGETFKRSQEPTAVKRYVNYKFDDYCKIEREKKLGDPPAVARVPARVFNLSSFQDSCYIEEDVVII
ncbi:uncharacterized protein LOC5574726 [Aedes aegypti]|uniref:Uncharacterized protein n=1 Tax=Aedes aegypti TaxID=7159 RepID=A0A6I8TKX0_AEDAE|nr:uncharacterized protein LOC5574726 [Aedes aegypti]